VIAASVLYAYRSGRESVPELARVDGELVPSDMSEATGPKSQVAQVAAPAVPVADNAPPVVPPVSPPAVPAVPAVPSEPSEAGEAGEAGEPDEPPDERGEPHRAGSPRTPLPERLSSIELADGMRKLTERVTRDCSRFAMRKMEVGLRIEVAASGKVQDAAPTGLQSGALGACVAKVARGAKYRRARQGAEFVYTFRM
jgi:hypothetical protein